MRKRRVLKDDDWNQLGMEGLSFVLDPMVLRCGELFLKGAEGVQNRAAVSELFSKNLLSIATFFDQLILRERIPVFNYSDTFDMHLDFDQNALNSVNFEEEILVDIDVGYSAYSDIKASALQELSTALSTDNLFPLKTRSDILSEMAASGYEWSPSLNGLERKLDPEQVKLIQFMLAGLIFGGYAQRLEGDHYLHPKRSRLFLAASLQSKHSEFELEERLFGELRQFSNLKCDEVPWQPSFFPFLLSKSDSAPELLKNTIALRNSNEAKDYRRWYNQVLIDWKVNGRIGIDIRNEAKSIAEKVKRKIGYTGTALPFETKVTIADVVSHAFPIKLDVLAAAKLAWGWILPNIPGHRHRKLLSRVIATDYEYVKLERTLYKVWSGKRSL